jgi:hypothetical protein
MADQLSFDLGGQAAPAAEHPGQLPFNQWAKSRSTVFHASHRADWQQGEYAHVGTQTAASDRLLQVSANTSPTDKSSQSDMPSGGRIWARRMTQTPAMQTTSDSNLNIAQAGLTYHPHDVAMATSIKDAPEVTQIAQHLRAGRPVAYPNAFEDTGSKSALVPRPSQNLRAWHQDVAEAHSQGYAVHPHDVALSQQQFDPAMEITPKSMVQTNTERVTQPKGRTPEQLSLMPWSVGDKIFPINPNDPSDDRDNWGSPAPGRGSWNRAQAHAEATGGNTSLTAKSQLHQDAVFPSGRSHLGRKYERH